MSFDIRSSILSQAPKQQDIATPFWSKKDENGVEQVDGHIALQDIPFDQIATLQNDRKVGKIDSTGLVAAMVVKTLVSKDTGLPIFAETDRDAVKALGTTVLQPVFKAVTQFFGLDASSNVEELKKSSETTTSEDGGTGYVQPAYIRP